MRIWKWKLEEVALLDSYETNVKLELLALNSNCEFIKVSCDQNAVSTLASVAVESITKYT